MIDAVKNMPNVKLKIINNGVINLSNSRNLSKRKKIIIFGLPGAYTGTCSNEHFPSYIKLSDKFKKKGINEIYCMSVNDPYVMQAWQLSYKKGNKVIMIADGNGDLTKALELDEDRSDSFMGLRSKRFAMIVDNNQIIALNVDEQGKYKVSAAENILNQV